MPPKDDDLAQAISEHFADGGVVIPEERLVGDNREAPMNFQDFREFLLSSESANEGINYVSALEPMQITGIEPNNITFFSSRSEEILKLCHDGIILVHGKPIGKDIELVNALREFVTEQGRYLPPVTEDDIKIPDYSNTKNKASFIANGTRKKAD